MIARHRRIAALGLAACAALAAAAWYFSPRPDDPLGPLPYRTKLVKELKQEAIEQVIGNLANFDDVYWVDIHGAGTPKSYVRLYHVIPSLNRVRRLLDHARANPGHGLEPVLMGELKARVDGHDKALKDRAKAYKETKGDFILTEPDDYEKTVTVGAASFYLLGEFKAYQALPLMADAFVQKKPVSQLFMFYAMHRLATTHPTEGLPADAIKALVDYRDKARFIPDPDVKIVPAWDASYEERDFRVQILKKDLSERYERTQSIVYYPAALNKYEGYFRETNAKGDYLAPAIRDLFPFLKAFIDKAYPPQSAP
jgi:hypothetical protein